MKNKRLYLYAFFCNGFDRLIFVIYFTPEEVKQWFNDCSRGNFKRRVIKQAYKKARKLCWGDETLKHWSKEGIEIYEYPAYDYYEGTEYIDQFHYREVRTNI